MRERIRLSAAGALAALSVVTLLLALPAGAAAGEYVVAQCDARHSGYADAHFDRTSGAYYDFTRACGGGQNALRIENIAAAPVAAEGRIHWRAPAGTGIVGVSADASLREDAGHRSRLAFVDAAGNQAGRVATGRDEPGGFEHFSQRLDGVGRAGFAALLICASQRPCPKSDQARAAVRNVRLTVKDRTAPRIGAGGSLLTAGWRRATGVLGISATDVGGGVRSLEVSVGGHAVALSKGVSCATLGSGQLAGKLAPCPATASASAMLDTRRPPFVNGTNGVRICARDFGSNANQACISRTVKVDNAPPAGAFEPISRSDPELITARIGDAHSGLASASISYRALPSGQWRPLATHPVPGGIAGRVDSSAMPPGSYQFRLVAADRAGNPAVITATREGRPMVAEFPLLEATRIRIGGSALGHRVRYGTRPRVRGRIASESGHGLQGLPLELVERFERGSRPRVRTRPIEAGPGGSFSARLSPGPSRKVSVRFAGTPRFGASATAPRKLAVAGRVSMKISRKRVKAGRKVRFRGRVGRAGARIPTPGKVVELQVRAPGERRFRTVGDALHSGRSGRVRASYRFGRFYRAPVRYRFRFKLTRQAGWPYRAPAHSRARRLTVKPR